MFSCTRALLVSTRTIAASILKMFASTRTLLACTRTNLRLRSKTTHLQTHSARLHTHSARFPSEGSGLHRQSARNPRGSARERREASLTKARCRACRWCWYASVVALQPTPSSKQRISGSHSRGAEPRRRGVVERRAAARQRYHRRRALLRIVCKCREERLTCTEHDMRSLPAHRLSPSTRINVLTTSSGRSRIFLSTAT